MHKKFNLKKILLLPYLVPLCVLTLMLICAALFTQLAASLVQPATHNPNNNLPLYETAPAQAFQTQGTVDPYPTFSVSSSAIGNTNSSQPPKTGVPTYAIPTITPTPSVIPTPTLDASPTPTFNNFNFFIQVASFPAQVDNNTTIPIQIHTGQANAILQLTATYNLPPYFYQVGNQQTDAAGNATIFWLINLTGAATRHGPNTTTAHFYINGVTTNGQGATSPMETIQIILH